MTGVTRVLYVIPGTGYGGAHNQVVTLAPHLAAAGYETSVVLPREPGDALERLRRAGVEVTTMRLRRLRAGRPVNNALLALTFPLQVLRLRRAILDQRADAVQVHGIQQLDAALAARLAGATLVWQLLDTRAPRALMRALRPALRRLAHAVLVTGEATAGAHGVVVGEGGVHSYYPPVADTPLTRTREDVRELLGVPPGALLVGSLANLNPQKGHEHLLEAFLTLQYRDLGEVEVSLRVRGGRAAGHEGYTRRLEALGQRVEPGAAVVGELEPGCTPRELIAALDVFVLPAVSRSEGLPTVIIEAMTAGVCVVASRVGGIPDLVEDGVTGLLVPPGSSPALADALQRLVTDPDLRGSFAAAARERARARFSVQDTLASYLAAHREAARRAGRAPATDPR